MIIALVTICPNLEILRLNNKGNKNESVLDDVALLSAINFPNLTSLHLYRSFQLGNGSFLLTVKPTLI